MGCASLQHTVRVDLVITLHKTIPKPSSLPCVLWEFEACSCGVHVVCGQCMHGRCDWPVTVCTLLLSLQILTYSTFAFVFRSVSRAFKASTRVSCEDFWLWYQGILLWLTAVLVVKWAAQQLHETPVGYIHPKGWNCKNVSYSHLVPQFQSLKNLAITMSIGRNEWLWSLYVAWWNHIVRYSIHVHTSA